MHAVHLSGDKALGLGLVRGPHSHCSPAYKPQARNNRRAQFLGEFYSFTDPVFTGARGAKLCLAQRQGACQPSPALVAMYRYWVSLDHLQSHLAEATGLCLGPELQRQCWAHYPLASGPLGTLGLQLVVLVLLSPKCLERLGKLTWQGELSGASFLQAALSLLSPQGDMVILRGWAEAPLSPRLQGQPRSPRQAPCQGHNTEGRAQSFIADSSLDKPSWSHKGDYGATKHFTQTTGPLNYPLGYPLPTQPSTRPEFGALPGGWTAHPTRSQLGPVVAGPGQQSPMPTPTPNCDPAVMIPARSRDLGPPG